MNKEDFLNNDFLKQFKTGEELNDFLKSIQKRGIEKILVDILVMLTPILVMLTPL